MSEPASMAGAGILPRLPWGSFAAEFFGTDTLFAIWSEPFEDFLRVRRIAFPARSRVKARLLGLLPDLIQ